jgi:hypothetical protein
MYAVTEQDREAAGRGDQRAWLLVRAERISNEVMASEGVPSTPAMLEWHRIAATLKDEYGIIIYPDE